MVYVYPNTISTFIGDEAIAIANGYKKVSDSDYEDLVETKLMWVNGELVEDTTYPQRKAEQEEEERRKQERDAIINEVSALKKNLADSDYIAIKHSEGWISDEDYAPTKAQRQAWRDRINELEN